MLGRKPCQLSLSISFSGAALAAATSLLPEPNEFGQSFRYNQHSETLLVVKKAVVCNFAQPHSVFCVTLGIIRSRGDKMDPVINDLALDLEQFALDNELEKGRKRTQPIARLEARQTGFATISSRSAAAKSSSKTSVRFLKAAGDFGPAIFQ